MIKFQSLFQWILLSNACLTNRAQALLLFQSLFQWILLSNRIRKSRKRGDYSQFQSLFQWILLSNPPPCELLLAMPWVSILVLVDLAFELQCTAVKKEQSESFNPCFSGSCFRIHIFMIPPPDQLLVSILVLVDLAFELLHIPCIQKKLFVSILVLVDLAFEL